MNLKKFIIKENVGYENDLCRINQYLSLQIFWRYKWIRQIDT